ncbi:unnamed protein product [Mortierella alpina]
MAGNVKTDRFRMVVERYFARQVRRPTEVAKARRSPRTLNKGPASCSTSVTEDELRVDGLTLKRGTETIGQRIKEAALELDLLAETGFASVHQRRVYALGGSSILDLVDRSPESQLHQVFSDSTERDELLAMFRHLRVFKSSKFQEPVELLAHWDVVMAFARSGGLSAARSYLFREMAACVPDKVNDLWLLLIMVDALINNQHLFLGKVDITEADFLNVLWQPLLSRLFYERQGETDLRLKTGESTAAASNFEKRRFYEDSGALAFKIDVRIIQDHAVEGEIDLAAVEVARNYQDVKIFADGTKVLREAKGVVDRLAQIFPDNKDFPRRTVGLGMQISCLTGIVFSVHLVAPRLYVAWPEYRFALPSSVGTLHLFTDVIRAFTLFRNTLQQTTAHVKSALASKRSIEALYGYIDTEEPLGRKSWVSGNWFTPPKSVKTKSIKHLIKCFGCSALHTMKYNL